jgi:hypothetical protein
MNTGDFSKAGARFLKPHVPIHESLKEQYHKNAQRMNWTMESIKEVLAQVDMDGDDSQDQQGPVVPVPLKQKKSKNKEKNKRRADTIKENTRLFPVDLLTNLRIAMSHETEPFAFPCMCMHKLTW